jgi:hypothetical protein
MADAISDIYSRLGRDADRTAANFGAIQQSLIQTRAVQLRERQQLFDNDMMLRKMDIAEKQNAFDNAIALKKLGMAERQMGFGDVMEAAKLESVNALTRYREAQTAKLEAGQTAAQNIPYPVNGTPEEIINWKNQTQAAGSTIEQSWGIPQDNTYLPSDSGAYVPDPNDPLDVATAQAYQEQGGAVSSSDLPMDSGSDASSSLFSPAPTDAIAGGLFQGPRMGAVNLTPSQKAVGQIAAATAAQTTPKDNFEEFFQAANFGISSTLADPNIPQGTKSKLISQMQAGLMRGAMQYRENPKAQAFLNDVAPERDRVKAAAARGEEQIAQSIIRANESRLGFFNPILADAEAEGYAIYAQNQAIKDAAETKKAIRDELMDTRNLIKGYKDAGDTVPADLLATEKLLISQLYTVPVQEAQINSRVNADRPR